MKTMFENTAMIKISIKLFDFYIVLNNVIEYLK